MSSLRIAVVCYLSFLFLYQLFYSKVTLRRLSLLTHYPCFTFNFSHQENFSSFFFTFQSRSILISFIVLLYDVLQSVTITSLLPLLRSFSTNFITIPFSSMFCSMLGSLWTNCEFCLRLLHAVLIYKKPVCHFLLYHSFPICGVLIFSAFNIEVSHLFYLLSHSVRWKINILFIFIVLWSNIAVYHLPVNTYSIF